MNKSVRLGVLGLGCFLLSFLMFYVSGKANGESLKIFIYIIGILFLLCSFGLGISGTIVLLKARKEKCKISDKISALLTNGIIMVILMILMWITIFGKV